MCAAETYTILIVFGYPYLYIYSNKLYALTVSPPNSGYTAEPARNSSDDGIHISPNKSCLELHV